MTPTNTDEPRFEFQFERRLELGLFEQALTNSVEIFDRTEGEQTPQRQAQTDASQRVILPDIIDRVQRLRHAAQAAEQEPPLEFELVGEGEVITAIAALAKAAEMTRKAGAAEGYDPEEVQQLAADLALRIDDAHPDESIVEGIEIEFPYGEEDEDR